MTAKHKHLLIVASVVGLFVIAGCTAGPAEIEKGTASLQSYVKAKSEYGEALNAVIAKQDPRYRIAAINGPQYPAGAVLDPQNPADLVTTACVIPEAKLTTTPWTPLPSVDDRKAFSFAASIPQAIQPYISWLSDLGLKLDASRTGAFSLTEMSQKLAARDLFAETLASDRCASAIANREVVVVRGIVLAKERYSSGRVLDSEVNVKIAKQNTVTVRYDDKKNSLNLSLFVEDQNGPGIGQTLPFSLCSRPLGLMPLVRSVPPARTHSDAESSARIERSPRILGGWFC